MVIPDSIAKRLAAGELIPVIAQDSSNNEVLMLAWMNSDALEETIESGQVTYWSRSRKSLWRKGETSGNTQQVVKISYDCDSDAILLQVVQSGAACHTGEKSCFHNSIEIK